MGQFNIKHKPEHWRLFFDSSRRSLKVVLGKLGYSHHEWMISGDLKALSMLLDQQSGFLCERDC